MESGGGRGTVRDHTAIDLRRCDIGSERNQKNGQNDDGEHKIRERTGGNDHGALVKRLERKRDLLLPRRQLLQPRAVGNARRVVVAEEFDIAPERHAGDLPPRPIAIVPARERGTEPDRERIHPHTAGARDEEMTKLMEEDDRRDHQQERYDVMHRSADQVLHGSKHFMSFFPRLSVKYSGCAAPAEAARRPAGLRIEGQYGGQIDDIAAFAVVRTAERIFDHGCNIEKPDLSFKKGRHGDLICRVQDRRFETARLQTGLCEREAGKALEIRRFECQLLRTCQVQAQRRRCDP